jgi:hypothetical protein
MENEEVAKYQLHGADQPSSSGSLVDKLIKTEGAITLHNYQKVIATLMSPHYGVDRMLLMHSTGVGKTITSLSTAMRGYQEDNRNIFVLGFSKSVFKRELLTKPELGVVSVEDVQRLEQARQAANRFRTTHDHNAFNAIKRELALKLKRRGDKGIFFIGYKELINKMFVRLSPGADTLLEGIRSAEDIEYGINTSMVIKRNQSFWDDVQGSYVICDEMHNLYNSSALNSWGVCLKYLLDNSVAKTIFCSATPVNNSPYKVCSVVNLLTTGMVSPRDLFNNGVLTPQGERKLADALHMRISYLIDRSGEHYPELVMHGVDIAGDGYLKFIKCPISTLHRQTIRAAENHDTPLDTPMPEPEEAFAVEDDHAIEEEDLTEFYKDEGMRRMSLEGSKRYLNDFVFPTPGEAGPHHDGVGMYLKKEVVKAYSTAGSKELKQSGVQVAKSKTCGTTFSGEFLRDAQLKTYSAKYHRFLGILSSTTGKVFAYHNYVQLTGVCLISEILKMNGWVEWGSDPAPDTICAVCSRTMETHNATTGADGLLQCSRGKTTFVASRFYVVTGSTRKADVDSFLDIFNSIENLNGHNCRMILGSRAIKESYDLKAIRSVVVLHQPENISTFIQIIGRAVRNGSHALLPPEERRVDLYILLSSYSNTPKPESFEEHKWVYKLRVYKQIQRVNAILLDVAVDYDINFDKNSRNSRTGLYATLAKRPKKILAPGDKLRNAKAQCAGSTFNAWWVNDEVESIRSIIKRLMVEYSPVWQKDELYEAVRSPPFAVSDNMRLSHREVFEVALDSLVHKHSTIQSIISKGNIPQGADEGPRLNAIARTMLDGTSLAIIGLDGVERNLHYTQGGIVYLTVAQGERVDTSGLNPLNSTHVNTRRISILPIVQARGEAIFNEQFRQFKDKYMDTRIEEMGEAVVDYSIEFNRGAITRCCIVANCYLLGKTDSTAPRCRELEGIKLADEYKHIEFYRKMVYVYNKFRCIIWANYDNDIVQKRYSKLCRRSTRSEHTTVDMLTTTAHPKRDQTTTSIQSLEMEELRMEQDGRYDQAFTKECSKGRAGEPNEMRYTVYYKYKKYWVPNAAKSINCWSFCLPVGHIFDTDIAIIDQETTHQSPHGIGGKQSCIDRVPIHTFAAAGAPLPARKWKDAGDVVGFLEKDRSGLYMTFKLRIIVPSDKLPSKQVDHRRNIIGVTCANISKEQIDYACSVLKLPIARKKRCACHDIKVKLIELELKERIKGSNKRYFYFYWEQQAHVALR